MRKKGKERTAKPQAQRKINTKKRHSDERRQIEDKQKRRKVWKKVEVNVEDHIKFSKFPEHLSPENYSDHFDDYISKIATSQLPKDKPLWEVHTFNYPTKNNAAATLIVKFHHAVGDGTSLMGVVFSCFKRVDDPTLPLTFPSTTRTSSSKGHQLHDFKATLMKVINIVPKFLCSMLSSIYDFGQTLRVVLVEDDLTPIRSGNTNMAIPCSAKVCSVTLSLTDVKRIKSILQVSVNDVVMGIISFATRLYIQDADQGGRLKNARITASMTINLRSVKRFASPEEMRKEKTWGNKISVIEMPLPNLEKTDIRNPLNFVMKAHKILKRKKSSVGAIYLTAWTLDAIRTFAGFKAPFGRA
ncbi:LOW QUALITY PROTEIN: wax ester synthase/diacylglycerol acyltransferase 1 [Beta vulgaris subsp. vulgaris]|uniref:LOW QUALITY PROTEIN: wax ester synthase/diacylglycerol acyltransferase 1 n=1 Tax=Beta vulgaris subsp. vulgaris TaxID=3555 RepID=UPI002548169B|nr:LOW QUALITY PROTEIN: wax ester synthase/diacylglycerol acyltransferase 1 [Beta vulgaris subsp. vulgaris]